MRGKVAGRLLPVLPHDPGPSADAKEKVIRVAALPFGVFGKYLS